MSRGTLLAKTVCCHILVKAAFTNHVLPIFEQQRRSPLRNRVLEECDLLIEAHSQTAWVSFGKQRGALIDTLTRVVVGATANTARAGH
jgi:hypothetical protein